METQTTKSATKRKGGRVKKISLDEAEREKEAAVEEAILKAKKDWEKEQEEKQFGLDEEEFNGDNMYNDEYYEEGEVSPFSANRGSVGEEFFDIFDFCEENFDSKGVPVIYYIKKDNQLLNEEIHPCSFSTLQKKYGGGTYQIQAKHQLTKKYLKSQTARVADIPTNREQRKDEPVVIHQAAAQGPDMNVMMQSMMEMFSRMQEMSSKEKAREEREEKKSSNELSSTMFNLITAQQKASQDMFLKIAEMSSKASESQSNNFAKVIEKMDDKFTKMIEKLADSSKNSKPEFGTLELIRMMNESETKGRESMERLFEMVEERSAAKGDESESKESLLASLVKGMAPILAGAKQSMTAAQNPYQGGAQIPQPQRVPQPRPSGTPPQNMRPPQPNTPKPNNMQKPNSFEEIDSLGLPRFRDDSVKAPINELKPLPLQSENINNIGFKPQINDKEILEEREAEKIDEELRILRGETMYQNASNVQKTIAEIAIPTMANFIFNNDVSARECGFIVLEELQRQGFPPKVVVKNFTFKQVMEAAKMFGIESEKKEWLEEFYDTLQEAAGTESSGEEESALN